MKNTHNFGKNSSRIDLALKINLKELDMNTKNTFLISAIFVFLCTGCAEQKIAEQKVEKEIKEAPALESEAIAESARDYILNSKVLTSDQKNKLIELQKETHDKNSALALEIEKVKTVLMQTVLTPKMNIREFAILKKKLSSLEKKKMDNGFKAITEVRNIIEPMKIPQNREFYNNLYHSHFQEF